MAWAVRPGPATRLRTGGRILIAAFLALSLFRAYHLLRREMNSSLWRDVAAEVRRVVPPGSLVIVVGDGNPTMLYHADRKGWNPGLGTLTEDWIDARRAEGATYLLAAASRFDAPGAGPTLEMLRRRFVDRSDTKGLHLFELKGP